MLVCNVIYHNGIHPLNILKNKAGIYLQTYICLTFRYLHYADIKRHISVFIGINYACRGFSKRLCKVL